MAVLVIGGGSAGVLKFMDHAKASGQKSSFQRQENVAIGASTSVDPEADKLKTVSLKAKEDEKLAKQIKSKLKNVPGGQKWSVYVRDLESDRMASINADTMIDAAGLSSLFMMAPLEAKFTSNKWNYKVSGKTMTQCVQDMISASDTTCASVVSQYAGIKNVDPINNGLGFTKTTINDKKQQTTAREMGEMLFKLQNSQILSDKARRTVFDGLYGQKNREGVPAGCDDKCLVAHAIGENKTVRHDAAIVTSGDAKYIVVIMSPNGASWSQISDVAASIRQSLQP